MEARPRRNTKFALKGAGGPSRRSGGRGREFVSASTSAGISLSEAGESGGTGTSKNALRERTRVESLRRAYLELQAAIPSVPPNTKLSKLDVLVLATTYISHLSQLLHEDDTRATHDTNNNNTSSASVKPGSQEHRALHTKTEEPTRKGPQKGLLHPVKKWPMRARLYPGAGGNEAATLLPEQQNTNRHHHRAKPLASSPYPLAPHLDTPAFQHTHLGDYTAAGSVAGILGDDGSAADLNDRTTFLCSGLAGTQHCLPPPPYSSHLTGTWEAEGAWDPSVTYSDLTSCPQPCAAAAYTGCWASWEA